jgi:hypothetical protein
MRPQGRNAHSYAGQGAADVTLAAPLAPKHVMQAQRQIALWKLIPRATLPEGAAADDHPTTLRHSGPLHSLGTERKDGR